MSTRTSRLWYNFCMSSLSTASLAAFGEVVKIDHTVMVSPNKAKNKAFRMTEGSAVCDLYLTPEAPWTIRDSKIVESDDRTLWKERDKAHYFIFPYDYGGHEYVKIKGDLYKQGSGKGSGKPDLPWFNVTVPKVDLQWDKKHGDASKEEKEDKTPVVLVVTESKDVFGKLIIKAPEDDFRLVERRVTLTWSNPGAVKVLDGEKVRSSGVAYVFKPKGKTEQVLDVCAVKPGEVKFTLEGEPDVVNKDRAVDYVKATCVALDFEVKSDKKYDYDAPTTEMLIDNRTATITVKTTPAGVDVSNLGITFEAATEEKDKKNLVNCFNKFDVVIEHKAGNKWKTKDVVYWYGVKPNRLGYKERLNYVFDLKCHDEVIKSKKLSVRWPEGNSHAGWVPPVSNDTAPGEILHHTTTTPSYWYCKIDFKEFYKYPGFIWTDGFLDFHDTSQYSEETKSEEEYHVKQFRGVVDIEHGGLADCYTVKGLQYFVGELAKTDKYKNYITTIYDENGGHLGVKGGTEDKVEELAKSVIVDAVKREISESNSVRHYNGDKTGQRGYMELKAKEATGYNAAWLYEYTYLDEFGSNPKRKIHKAYQKLNPESYEVR